MYFFGPMKGLSIKSMLGVPASVRPLGNVPRVVDWFVGGPKADPPARRAHAEIPPQTQEAAGGRRRQGFRCMVIVPRVRGERGREARVGDW